MDYSLWTQVPVGPNEDLKWSMMPEEPKRFGLELTWRKAKQHAELRISPSKHLPTLEANVILTAPLTKVKTVSFKEIITEMGGDPDTVYSSLDIGVEGTLPFGPAKKDGTTTNSWSLWTKESSSKGSATWAMIPNAINEPEAWKRKDYGGMIKLQTAPGNVLLIIPEGVLGVKEKVALHANVAKAQKEKTQAGAKKEYSKEDKYDRRMAFIKDKDE